mmetsp:Transcript_102082/g.263937  ORF Transcript_102082/g.263937 Transcript_102082/m.263937 type:complete len:202 (+) Transcript_102082:953-1558(+)
MAPHAIQGHGGGIGGPQLSQERAGADAGREHHSISHELLAGRESHTSGGGSGAAAGCRGCFRGVECNDLLAQHELNALRRQAGRKLLREGQRTDCLVGVPEHTANNGVLLLRQRGFELDTLLRRDDAEAVSTLLRRKGALRLLHRGTQLRCVSEEHEQPSLGHLDGKLSVCDHGLDLIDGQLRQPVCDLSCLLRHLLGLRP